MTNYRKYNSEYKKRVIQNPLSTLYPDLPDTQYDIIYADPPWDYGGKMQFDKSSKLTYESNEQKNIFISSANFKYPTMKTKDLKRIPIVDIAKDNCLLFMWVTGPHLAQGIELGIAWGFEYKTIAFVWDKMVHNPGQYTMSYCELCLVFKRGKIPTPRGSRNIKQLISIKRKKHSEKPIEVLQAINKMFPIQSKIELFSRKHQDGWDCWGIDVMQ